MPPKKLKERIVRSLSSEFGEVAPREKSDSGSPDIIFKKSGSPDNLPPYSSARREREFMQSLGESNLMRAHVFPIAAARNLIDNLLKKLPSSAITSAISNMVNKSRDDLGSLSDKIPYIVIPEDLESKINSLIKFYAIEQSKCEDDEIFTPVRDFRIGKKIERNNKKDEDINVLQGKISNIKNQKLAIINELESPKKKSNKKRGDEIEQGKYEELDNLDREIQKIEEKIEKIILDKEVLEIIDSAILNDTEFAEQHPDVYLDIFKFILVAASEEIEDPVLKRRLIDNLDIAVADFRNFSSEIMNQLGQRESSEIFGISRDSISRAKTPVSTPLSTPTLSTSRSTTPRSSSGSTPVSGFIPRNNSGEFNSYTPVKAKKIKGKIKLGKMPPEDEIVELNFSTPSPSKGSKSLSSVSTARSEMCYSDVSMITQSPPSLSGFKSFISSDIETDKDEIIWLKTGIELLESKRAASLGSPGPDVRSSSSSTVLSKESSASL